MSERWFAALIALVLAAPAPAQVPSVADYRRRGRLLEHADSIAREADRRADSIRLAHIALDTSRAGDLLLLSAPSEAALAASGIRLAWSALDHTFGRRAHLLAGTRFLLYRGGQPQPVPDSGGSYGDKTYGLVIVPRGADAETVSRTLLAPASNAIALGEDSSLRNWMGATVVPGGVSRDLYRSVYSELVTAPWHATRACFLGDMAGCRRALGLAGGTDPLADWYSPGDYHQLVLEQQVRGTAVPDQLNRCLHVPDDAACLAVLRSGWYRPNYRQSAWRPPSPLSPRARVTFVTVALETGGAGAYERLVADAAAPLPQRLAAAAGEPFDSLVTRWRARVIAAPAPPVAVPERSAWMVVGWALIFGFLALRSTRWR